MSKILRHSLSLVLALTAMSTPSELVAGDYQFTNPANRLGWVNSIGKLSIWITDDEALDLGEGESLPLNIQFSGMQGRVADGALGVGWWVPLLESTVVKKSARSVLFATPGGTSTWLYAMPKEDGEDQAFRSQNHQWLGKVADGGRFYITGPDGWKLTYRDGRIARATTPKGKQLKWNYDSNKRVRNIVEEGGEKLVKVKAGNTGLIEKIELVGAKSYEFEYGQYPQAVKLGGVTTVAGILSSVSRITERLVGEEGKAGELVREHVFDLKLDRESGAYQMDYTDGKEGTEPVVENFVWGASDGVLKSDAKSKYELVKMGEEGKSMAKLVRNFNDGSRASYWWDAGKGIATKEVGGVKKKLYYLQMAGGSFGKISKIEQFSKREIKVVYKAYYDVRGRRLKELREGIVEYYVYNMDAISVKREEMSKNGEKTVLNYEISIP